MQGEYKCSNQYFGDPAPGMGKQCQCKEQSMSEPKNSTNSKNKEMYEQGELWGTWKEEPSVKGLDPIVIMRNGTCTTIGGEMIGNVTWDGKSNISLTIEGRVYPLTFIDEKSLEAVFPDGSVVRQVKIAEAEGGDYEDEDGDDEPYDQAVEMDTPVGEMSVEWDDGYYEGAVYLDDEEYAYNFRRSNAVNLGVSTIAMISAAHILMA
jgi:hypothetical protein